MKTRYLAGVLGALLLTAGLKSAPAARPRGAAPVFSDPLRFTNPFHPFVPGAVKLFAGADGKTRIAIADLYLSSTRTFLVNGVDVQTRVLQETEFEDGVLKEISLNFFAQADDGTVYYFGETVDNYEHGVVVDNDGSWLVGGPTLPGDPPDTASTPTPAVFMPANPQVGQSWKPEDIFPIVDETTTAVALNRRVRVLAGSFEGVMQVRETSRLNSDAESKWYAPGVGVIKVQVKRERYQLIASTF